MSRKLWIAAAALVALLAGPYAAGAQERERAPAKVRVVECQTGSAAERLAVFRGAMGAIEGTERMEMRFRLLERVGDSPFEVVEAPGLDVWRRSRPDVLRFVHRQRVLGLARAARYRMVVDFRWRGADGERIRRARRLSGTCRQPGELPNLRVVRVGKRPAEGLPDTFRYAIRVVNLGRAPADGVEVGLTVDGAEVDTVDIGTLAVGGERRVSINGPACKRSVEAIVDPADTIRESSERDNARTRRC